MKRLVTCALMCAFARADAAVCSFDSVSPMAFGSYDVFATAPDDSTASVTYSCSDVGANDTIVIELSAGNASSFFPRELVSGTARLAYNLFIDATRSIVFGDGTAGTAAYGPVAATPGSTVLHVYGRVTARQNVRAGQYADSIIMTIQY
jgi:spore coat protein U-like protein